MKVSEFRQYLNAAPQAELRFVLPDGGLIPVHAHITEVGRTDRKFLDCGGTLRETSACTLQAWVADDTAHRLSPGGLVNILEKAAPILETDALDVEVEYEDGILSQFPIVESQIADGMVIFRLTTKHTDCLAKELCLPASADSCCSTGGCCA